MADQSEEKRTENKDLVKSLFGSDEEDEEEYVPQQRSTAAQSSTPSAKPTARNTDRNGTAATTTTTTTTASPASAPQRSRATAAAPQEMLIALDKIPHIPKDAQVVFFRVSNVVDIQTNEFEPDSFVGEDTKPETIIDETGKEHTRARPQDVIRWRVALGPDGNLIKQSNTRLVKWSDGSMHMFVGKEPIKVAVEDLKQPNVVLSMQPDAMQSEVTVTTRYSFAHEKMSAIRDRVRRANAGSKRQTRMAAITVDPEQEKRDKEKMEDEKLKISERYDQKLRRKTPLRTDSTQSMANYLEEDDDDILATKVRAKQRKSLEGEEEKANRLLAAKESRKRDDADEDDMIDEDDAMDVGGDDL